MKENNLYKLILDIKNYEIDIFNNKFYKTFLENNEESFYRMLFLDEEISTEKKEIKVNDLKNNLIINAKNFLLNHSVFISDNLIKNIFLRILGDNNSNLYLKTEQKKSKKQEIALNKDYLSQCKKENIVFLLEKILEEIELIKTIESKEEKTKRLKLINPFIFKKDDEVEIIDQKIEILKSKIENVIPFIKESLINKEKDKELNIYEKIIANISLINKESYQNSQNIYSTHIRLKKEEYTTLKKGNVVKGFGGNEVKKEALYINCENHLKDVFKDEQLKNYFENKEEFFCSLKYLTMIFNAIQYNQESSSVKNFLEKLIIKENNYQALKEFLLSFKEEIKNNDSLNKILSYDQSKEFFKKSIYNNFFNSIQELNKQIHILLENEKLTSTSKKAPDSSYEIKNIFGMILSVYYRKYIFYSFSKILNLEKENFENILQKTKEMPSFEKEIVKNKNILFSLVGITCNSGYITYKRFYDKEGENIFVKNIYAEPSLILKLNNLKVVVDFSINEEYEDLFFSLLKINKYKNIPFKSKGFSKIEITKAQSEENKIYEIGEF